MKRNFIIYLILANIFISLANLPQVLHKIKNPPSRIYLFAHTDWPHDYYSYLATVTQGKNGDWLYHTPYTTEKTSPGIYHLFYILLGKIARLFSFDAFFSYHLVRFLTLEIFVLLLYLTAGIFLGQKFAFWGGLFALVGTISPLSFFSKKIDLGNYPLGIPWWMSFDALERLNGLPHHIFGQSLLLLSLIFFFWFLEKKSKSLVVLTALSAFWAGIIFPPAILPLAFALPASFLCYGLKRKSGLFGQILLPLFLIVASAFLSYSIIRWQDSLGFPWDSWRKGELARWNSENSSFNSTIPFTLGLLPILALPTILLNLKKPSFKISLLSIWAVLPFVFLPFANYLQIPKIRLFQASLFTPWGFLAAYFIFYVLRGKKMFSYLLLAVFLVFSLSVSFNILTKRVASITQTTYYTHADPWHLPLSDYQALSFIEKNLPKGSVVLSEIYMGNIMPAFSPVTSYIGHFEQTLNKTMKENEARQFYSQRFSDVLAFKFLQTNGISYVYFGRNEKKMAGGGSLDYSLLQSIYHNDEIDLFKVITVKY